MIVLRKKRVPICPLSNRHVRRHDDTPNSLEVRDKAYCRPGYTNRLAGPSGLGSNSAHFLACLQRTSRCGRNSAQLQMEADNFHEMQMFALQVKWKIDNRCYYHKSHPRETMTNVIIYVPIVKCSKIWIVTC